MALTDTQRTMKSYYPRPANRGDYSRHSATTWWSKSVGPASSIGAVKPEELGRRYSSSSSDRSPQHADGRDAQVVEAELVRKDRIFVPYSIYDVAAGKITALRLYFTGPVQP